MTSTRDRLDKKIREVMALALQLPDGLEYLASQLTGCTINVPELKKRFQDAAVDRFKEQCLELTQAPYVVSPADMVHLTQLRKGYGIDIGTEPSGWAEAIVHYFGSPLGKYSIADMCVRYSIFRNSPVDRYGKPLNHQGIHNGQESQAQGIERRNNENARAALAILRRKAVKSVGSGDSNGSADIVRGGTLGFEQEPD